MFSVVAAAALASAPPSDGQILLAGANHALEAHRLDQAGVMIARAMASGVSGPSVDRALANLVYARGNFREAAARYDALLKSSPDDPKLLEPAAIAQLKIGNTNRADALLRQATARGSSSWGVWNACGVVADHDRDWMRADDCYARAVELAPNEAEPVNNLGWSLLLRGDWNGAIAQLERAVTIDPSSKRAQDNLELARTAVATALPERGHGESDRAWAARLNDAGVAAVLRGDKTRAAAAFTQALDVSGSWYSRAANNLDTLRNP